MCSGLIMESSTSSLLTYFSILHLGCVCVGYVKAICTKEQKCFGQQLGKVNGHSLKMAGGGGLGLANPFSSLVPVMFKYKFPLLLPSNSSQKSLSHSRAIGLKKDDSKFISYLSDITMSVSTTFSSPSLVCQGITIYVFF